MRCCADPNDYPRLPGRRQLRNSRHFNELLGGPAECGATQIQMITLASLGAVNCVVTFVSSWEVQRSEVLRRSNRLPSPPWALLCNCRHFRQLLGGPAERGASHIRMITLASLGAANCAAVASSLRTFCASLLKSFRPVSGLLYGCFAGAILGFLGGCLRLSPALVGLSWAVLRLISKKPFWAVLGLVCDSSGGPLEFSWGHPDTLWGRLRALLGCLRSPWAVRGTSRPTWESFQKI